MRYLSITAALAMLALGCRESEELPLTGPATTQAVQLSATGVRNFRTHLNGRNQVPSPIDTRGQGQAIFKLSQDGTELYYKLIVSNTEDVFMAHIHRAPADANGPVVAWLYPDMPPPSLIPGRTDGVLAEGTITAADLMGPLAGMSLAMLVAEIESGNTYVNVHTSAFPGGEIRGQIR